MPCSGDTSTICGGPDRITIYKYHGKELPAGATVLSSYKDFTSQGCYTDSVQARIMNQVAANGQMAVETCIDTCVAADYEVAGVEYGTECYCPATLPADSNKAAG
ncbi:SubName: Full=Related to copper radical oxidase-Phanerochaete chrysosporium {ECO:0000313/EMBL:CCA67346.1} [Serendipita indica DSM 11827]|nr:SubName: Full=Related to copper radical oxidase-Phanerochaete chrysosporium {ECO:0000313/EMBL:CCA67346.1} [Serendipita indica DSM 11827]